MSAVLSLAGDVAQVVIAAVAVYLARRANSINHDAVFLARALDDLIAARASAHKVKRMYAAMFSVFTNVEDKRAARTQWLEERESVTVHLDLLAQAFPETASVKNAWEKVEDEEDSHVLSDSLVAPTGAHARVKCERVCAQFFVEVAECIRRLRDKSK